MPVARYEQDGYEHFIGRTSIESREEGDFLDIGQPTEIKADGYMAIASLFDPEIAERIWQAQQTGSDIVQELADLGYPPDVIERLYYENEDALRVNGKPTKKHRLRRNE